MVTKITLREADCKTKIMTRGIETTQRLIQSSKDHPTRDSHNLLKGDPRWGHGQLKHWGSGVI